MYKSLFAIMLVLSMLLFSLLTGQNDSIVSSGDTNRGSYGLPLKSGAITSSYGMRLHPIKKRQMFHDGVDVAAPSGTDVYAVAAGQVIYAGLKGNYGKVIVLSHGDNNQSLYAQLSEISVEVGQIVNGNEIIGAVGQSGISTGAHLHFELKINGDKVDPEKEIDFSILTK